MIGENFKFFDPPTTKRRPFKFFAKLNVNHILMANFSRLLKYQAFSLTELHNFSKVSQLVEYSTHKKTAFTITGPSNIQLLKFWLVNFPNFQTTFAKNFMKKRPGFKIDFQSAEKVLPLYQYLWAEISRQWTYGPWTFFEICMEEHFAS